MDPMLKTLLEQEEEIRESWQIVQIFEEERQKFTREKAEHEALLHACEALQIEKERLEQQVGQLHGESAQLSENITQLRDESARLHEAITQAQAEIERLKIMSQEKTVDEPEASKKQDVRFPNYLSKLEVKLGNNKKTLATPLKKVYSHQDVRDLYSKAKEQPEPPAESIENTQSSQQSEKELEDMRQKLLDLELENAKLNVENRDLKFENSQKRPGEVTDYSA